MAKTVEELKEAYEEVIDVMDLKETVKGKKVPVSVPEDADEAYLTGKLLEAIDMIEAGDKFTDETQAVLDDLKTPAEEVEEVKPVRGAKKAAKPAKEEDADAPAEKKPKGKKPEKAGEPGKPGIIQTIADLVRNSGKGGISKADILAELQESFPGRDAKSMTNTINVQLPARLNKEKFLVKKLENGNYTFAGELSK